MHPIGYKLETAIVTRQVFRVLSAAEMEQPRTTAPVTVPRVVITYCTQCRWMLRAAYFAQELLSTFGLAIGEIALVPATGGIFNVTLTYKTPTSSNSQGNEGSQDAASPDSEVRTVLLWDRKAEGGFPETKVLKQRVRDHIEPQKDLGHSDVGGKKGKAESEKAIVDGAKDNKLENGQKKLEDCLTCP